MTSDAGESDRSDRTAMDTVLFVVNYPANTGFAWTHIEGLFARVADALWEERGTLTFVAYPEIGEPPETLAGSAARPVELDASLASWGSIRETIGFVLRHRVRVLYLTDRALRDWRYALLRVAGIRRVIVHDRTSGEATRPGAVKRLLKGALNRIPLVTASQYVAVSDFVRERLLSVACLPERKVSRVYNGFSLSTDYLGPRSDPDVREALGLGDEVPIVACACRAAPEKGVHHLLAAFDRLLMSINTEPKPVFVYLGDGPAFEGLLDLRNSLASRDRILFEGYVADAVGKLRTSDVFVVPSLWQDAFPSAVLEPMALGKPVIASSVGGIPEMIEHGVTGILVAPGDEEALTHAMWSVLSRPEEARGMGARARERVEARFSLADQVRSVAAVIEGRRHPYA